MTHEEIVDVFRKTSVSMQHLADHFTQLAKAFAVIDDEEACEETEDFDAPRLDKLLRENPINWLENDSE